MILLASNFRVAVGLTAICLAAFEPTLTTRAAEPETVAQAIVQQAGLSGGLVVHLGCRDGKLTAALRQSPQFLVQGLARDDVTVKRVQAQLVKAGVYGPVSADVLPTAQLPYADNLVNLIVVSDLDVSAWEQEIYRVLAPKGIAVRADLETPAGKHELLFRKPRPQELDEWTHWLHDPSGNAVAKDSVAGPPRRLQWMAGPLWSRHHNTVPSLSAMVSANGRVFTIVDEGPPGMAGTTPDKWFLVARDAFNGIELWRRPMSDWGWRAWSTIWNERFNQPNNVPKRLVAAGDRVYVTLGFNSELTALDAATGKIVKHYGGTRYTDEILYLDGQLILSINKQAQGPGEIKDKPPIKKRIAVLDAETGHQRWTVEEFVGNSTKTGPVERETHLLLAAQGDQVFLLDGDAVVSLDLETGRQLWRAPRPESPEYTSRYHHRMSEMCTLVATDQVVLLCQLEPIQKRIGWRVIKARLQAYDRETGKQLWQYRCGNWGHFCVPDVFVVNGLVWVHDSEIMSIVGLDPLKGIEVRRFSTAKALDNGHHHRCYRNKATERFLLTSYRGVEFGDWKTGEIDRNHWVRGTCRYGIMPCNGLLYSTPHPCDCYITSKLNGFYALAPAASGSGEASVADENRLEKGPAYGSADNLAGNPLMPGDWPMYRHDAMRTGCAGGEAPQNLNVTWQTTLPGGRITAPVVAGDRLLVAVIDAGTVHALAPGRGQQLWEFVAAGRIDTPPTLWNGMALFGSHNGWVYCLRLSDGQLIWRFLAAPKQRQVVTQGGLESVWPVHGSVMVHGGRAYFTAGRSSFLDGGIFTYCLDAVTGRLIEQHRVAHEQDMAVDTGRNQNDDTGLLSDLLVAEGDGIYMRHLRLFGEGPDELGWGLRVGSTAGMIDDSWFNRTMWLVDGRDCGELLVHDQDAVYGVRVHKSRGHGDYIVPGTGAYHVVASERGATIPRKPGVKDSLGSTSWPRPKQIRWSRSMPARVTAMAVGGRTLLCAGTPDELAPGDPWANYEGRRGGLLFALLAATGEPLAQKELGAAPVYDGLAVANGHAFISTVDGTVLCVAD